MKSHNMNIAKQNMLMTTELIKVMKLLEENNIEAISFKGPVLSQMAYGDITLRQYVDLDILIEEKELDKAIKSLSKNSYTFDKQEYQNKLKHKSIFHDISLYKNNISVELHWRLFSDEFKTNIENINIKENLSEVQISNYKFKSFKKELLVLYLAIHGAKHNWERIEWLLDIVKIIQTHQIDWQELIKIIEITRTEKILFSTLYLCQSILDLEIPKEVQDKINNPKILKLSKEFESLFFNDFKQQIEQNINTKNISNIQYKLLNGYKNKFAFILSLFKPTELDFKAVKPGKYASTMHYFVRPINIIKRWSKK